MVTNTDNNWAVRLATLVLWLLAGGSAVYWGLRLSAPVQGAPVPAVAAPLPAPDAQALARLLGAVDPQAPAALPVGASYLQSREVRTLSDLYSMGTGVTAVCDGKPVRCGSFAAPLYGENAADASVFTLNLTAGRGALLHCFCAVPESWQTLELTYHPDFAAGRSVTFTVHRSTDKAVLGMVPASPAEVGNVVDL